MANKEFNMVLTENPDSNYFDLTHEFKFTANMGELIPVLVKEAIPGDRWRIGAESLIRFAPLVSPVYHKIHASIHYFFVPNRILWDNWGDWISGNITTQAPFFRYFGGSWPAESVRFLDFMGIPPNNTPNFVDINALPLAAFQAIYNDYYRDQNLIPEVEYKLQDGNNTQPKYVTPRNRAWSHDYFTSCLPFAQKGSSVSIPLGDVVLDINTSNAALLWQAGSGGTVIPADDYLQSQGGQLQDVFSTELVIDPNGTLDVAPTTINDLRRAFKLQQFLELNARGGTRYTEKIKAHFGVNSSDARLQRPEYICGLKTPVVISEVLNTSGIDGQLPQGNMAGHGIAVMSDNGDDYYCEEHGFIIGVMSILPEGGYMDGIERQWMKFDPLDYYWPSFAHIGEQEVKNREIFAYGTDPDGTFGYIPRYSEYKYSPNRVATQFRSSLDFWTLARKFATQPQLNQQFIECNPATTKRIFAVDDPAVDNLYIMVLNKLNVSRKIPEFSIPSLL